MGCSWHLASCCVFIGGVMGRATASLLACPLPTWRMRRAASSVRASAVVLHQRHARLLCLTQLLRSNSCMLIVILLITVADIFRTAYRPAMLVLFILACRCAALQQHFGSS